MLNIGQTADALWTYYYLALRRRHTKTEADEDRGSPRRRQTLWGRENCMAAPLQSSRSGRRKKLIGTILLTYVNSLNDLCPFHFRIQNYLSIFRLAWGSRKAVYRTHCSDREEASKVSFLSVTPWLTECMQPSLSRQLVWRLYIKNSFCHSIIPSDQHKPWRWGWGVRGGGLGGGCWDVAQSVERRTVISLMRVRFPGAARDFSSRVHFQCRLSDGVRRPYTPVCSRMH